MFDIKKLDNKDYMDNAVDYIAGRLADLLLNATGQELSLNKYIKKSERIAIAKKKRKQAFDMYVAGYNRSYIAETIGYARGALSSLIKRYCVENGLDYSMYRRNRRTK